MTSKRKVHFENGALGLLIMLLLSQLFFTNGIYLFLGGVCFWFLFSKLQQPLKPSVFTLMLIYHIIQIMAGVWLSNFLGKDINFRSEHTDAATIFSYLGLAALFIPIIYFQNKIPDISMAMFKSHANRLSIEKSFNAYVVAFFVANALAGVAFVAPGLTQVIFSFVNIKWFFYILFGFQVISKKRMIVPFVIFTALEFSLGLFSYFSDFKTVLFFLAFISLVFLFKVNLKQIVVCVIAVYGLFYAGVLWTSIKGDYRAFLNQGNKTQTVNVERGEAIDKLIELSENSGDKTFDESAARFFDRLQYTYHLAKTMDRVPSELPYEYGGNIGSILSYVTTPRILNPGKASYSSTVKATKYTGIAYLGASQGVSFSLGYFADCYIDFGYFGMLFPLIALGFIFGTTYFYFVRKSSPNFIFNYAVVGAMFMEFNAYEMDGTFLLGRLYADLVTFYALKMFFFPWLFKYLSAEQATGKNYKEKEKIEAETLLTTQS